MKGKRPDQRWNVVSFNLPILAASSPSSITAVHLNLGHVGPTAAGAAATKVHCSRATQEDRDENGGHITSPGKPEESCRSLSFAAALRGVVGSVGDLVVENI